MGRKGKELCTNARNMIVKAYRETRNTSDLVKNKKNTGNPCRIH